MGKYNNRTSVDGTILNNVAADGAGTALDADGKNVHIFYFATSNSADFTVKPQISNSITEPTWGSAASAANEWGYCDFYTKDNVTKYVGSTGLVFEGSDSSGYIILNVEEIRWVNFIVSSYSAGNITIKGKLTAN